MCVNEIKRRSREILKELDQFIYESEKITVTALRGEDCIKTLPNGMAAHIDRYLRGLTPYIQKMVK